MWLLITTAVCSAWAFLLPILAGDSHRAHWGFLGPLALLVVGIVLVVRSRVYYPPAQRESEVMINALVYGGLVLASCVALTIGYVVRTVLTR